uniref:Caspase 10, apoptosis-related cysteine peptidase n=1 Tax=Cyprinus carpio TaxID=7962 RepID=A0A8C2JN15_CYPCA
MDLEFQRVLLKVQESLTSDEVQDLVFLCSDLLSLKDLSTVSSAGQLFCLLEKMNQLSREDPSLLLELLRIMKQNSLIRILTSEDYKQTDGGPLQLLYELSESICDQDLKNIKFLLLKTLSRKKLEKDTTLLQLFLDMEKEDLLGENNLDVLQKIIADINPSLEKRIIQYKTEQSLKVVFKWLGFEVLVEQDCSRNQILEGLRSLAARDHTPADCVVCCVLSHGQVEGIFGVDGEIVTFRELIETLSPNHCPSLYKKPKLFFIQACRGTDNHPAVFPQTCSEDEDALCSDAAVPRDSIPEMADYLLAMSTVPHYVSYREKGKGTWFIQSLCRSLQRLVPGGIDLLSILTQVNSDVSKKMDKSGLRKQMPRPEFTLTKRVVFPAPRTQRPLP